MGTNIGKNISRHLSGKHIRGILCLRNFLIMILKNATDLFKTKMIKWSIDSKWSIQKTTETTGDLTGNKIDNKITKIPKYLQENSSKIVTNGHDKYISPEERQEIIDKLWLK